MDKRLLLTLLLFFPLLFAHSQTVDIQTHRTIDGKFNNLEHEDWGAAGANLLRVAPVAYVDGISSMAGPDRPNPRDVSNAVFGQDGLLNDPLNLSDFCWVWGQFLDHDLGLTPEGLEPAMIQVPQGDPHFDPLGQGQAIIPMRRNIFDPATGTSIENPRQHPNMLTAFIDGSGVYGSSEATASWLRTFSGGKLKVSAGNLLPFNTTTGEFDDPIDPEAPQMDNATHISEKLFVAGDVRANENPLLTSFHTLFVREHNRLCDNLALQHPDWDDEQLYQHARKLVSGLIQSIVYDEWLPAMGIELPAYAGYKPEVNPGLSNVFTAAAFRLGHTLLNGTIRRLDNNGDVLPAGNLLLRDAFFNPLVVLETGSIDPFFKGMAVQIQQRFDAKMVDDIRNFLFGPPGAGGLDLASINIQRGRERGLPDFNTVRESFGLPRYSFFQQINADATVFTRLLGLYTDIDDVDPWVGMLAESAVPGALFGETVLTIIHDQFTALRDGDRFYYLNDPVLTGQEKNWIQKTTLHDLIMKNTGIILMQDAVFAAMPHSEICDNMTTLVEGAIRTEAGAQVSEVALALQLTGETQDYLTDEEGAFLFDLLPACQVESLSLSKTDEAANGVSTVDLIIIQKHILGVQVLGSPYKIIAADVDRNSAVTTLDLINIRRVILGIDNQFPNNTVWRFVSAAYDFLDEANPLAEDFVETVYFSDVVSTDQHLDFVAIKVGDVNNTVELSGLDEAIVETRDAHLTIGIDDLSLTSGETYSITLTALKAEDIIGFQFGLHYDTEALDVLDLEMGSLPGLTDDHFAHFPQTGLITTSWNAANPIQLGQTIYHLTIQAKRDGRLSRFLHLNSEVTQAVAINTALHSQTIHLYFDDDRSSGDRLAVYQNQPNPFSVSSEIPFYLPRADRVELRVFDMAGKLIYRDVQDLPAGNHGWTLDRPALPVSGIVHYQLANSEEAVSRKMVLLD